MKMIVKKHKYNFLNEETAKVDSKRRRGKRDRFIVSTVISNTCINSLSFFSTIIMNLQLHCRSEFLFYFREEFQAGSLLKVVYEIK